jgi:precorrin-6A/cobalt-precorrin-6A reductase
MTILILGGTGEAHQISAGLGEDAVVSLAHQIEGRTYASPVRRGGFGGEQAQTAWMTEAGIRAVIDASHPFAVQISTRTAAICAALALPYLRVLRPVWQEGKGDVWTHVPDARAAVAQIPEQANVLLAAGARHLSDFAGLRGQTFLRSVLPVDDHPFTNFHWINTKPGSVTEETDLMRNHAITHLVLRNSGGPRRGKLAAARDLGVKVVMIDRPRVPLVEIVETAEDAIQWGKEQ